VLAVAGIFPAGDTQNNAPNYTTPNVQIEGLAAAKRERSPESSKNRRP